MSVSSTSYTGGTIAEGNAVVYPSAKAYIAIFAESTQMASSSSFLNISAKLTMMHARATVNIGVQATPSSTYADKASFSLMQAIEKKRFYTFRLVQKIEQDYHTKVIRRVNT